MEMIVMEDADQPEEFYADLYNTNHIVNDVKVDDTTLRDGNQTPGVVFSLEEKLEVARLLDEIGVHQIEAGIPVSSPHEEEAVRRIVGEVNHASIIGWARALPKDVDAVARTGADAVAISMATSDIHLKFKLNISRETALSMMREAVKRAKASGLYVSVTAEDSSRTPYEFLREYAQAVKDAGADRLRLADTVGVMLPTSTATLVKRLLEDVGIPIEIHAHNDLGLAAANSLAAVEGGATWVSTTVNGIGERAGNAAFEPVVVGLKLLYGKDVGIDLRRIPELSALVSKASKLPVHHFAPIVGANVFRHSSGIHTHALAKNPRTYQLILPEEVGRRMEFIFDKYSGKSVLLGKMESFGLSIPEHQVDKLRDELVETSIMLKRAFTDEELKSRIEDFIYRNNRVYPAS